MFVTVKLLQLKLQRLVLILRKPYFITLNLRFRRKEKSAFYKMYTKQGLKKKYNQYFKVSILKNFPFNSICCNKQKILEIKWNTLSNINY